MADRIARWAARKLIIPNGRNAGKRFRLQSWQVEWIRGALHPDTREAGLSISRRNGKTYLIAIILLAGLCGPLNSDYWRAAVTSIDGDSAKEMREAIEAISRASGLLDESGRKTTTGVDPEKPIRVLTSPAPGRVEGLNGSKVNILAADRTSGHSLGLDYSILDEAGLWTPNMRGLWMAMITACGSRDGKLLAISVRGNSPMFNELAARAGSPGVFWCEYAASATDDPHDPKTWRKANPGIPNIKSEAHVAHQSQRAKETPADFPRFASLELNRPMSPDDEPIVSVSDWEKCIRSEDDLPKARGPVYIGIDLGGSASLSACSMFYPECKLLRSFGVFPTTPSLSERGLRDGVGERYVTAHRRGELETAGTRVSDVSRLLERAVEEVGSSQVAVVTGDRYRRSEFVEVMEASGLCWPLDLRAFGKGPDGSHNVLSFQRLVNKHELRTPVSLLLENAIYQSLILYDQNGNPSLDRSRQKGRIDPLSASVAAIGAAARNYRAGGFTVEGVSLDEL